MQKTKRIKSIITNQEFESALANPNYAKIIHTAIKNFNSYIYKKDKKSIKQTYEELKQHARIALWKALQSYDPEKPGASKFTTYLVRTILNEFMINHKFLNKPQGINKSYFIEDVFELDNKDFIDKYLECLSAQEKEIIKYKYMEDKTLEEIGIIYNYTAEGIRLKLNKIGKKLKNKFSGVL